MIPDSSPPAPLHVSARRERIIAAVFLALICYLTHFLRMGNVGLYEDDFAFVASAFSQTWGDFGQVITSTLTSWPQGRPIGYAAVEALAFIGFHIGGLYFLHLIALVIGSVNAFLCYLVLRHRLPIPCAAVGSIGFCAYPADTSQLFLCNPLATHLAASTFLGAILLYGKGRVVLSHALAATTFLIWEMAYIPFFAVPLLYPQAGRSLYRRLRSHSLVMVGVMVSALAIRRFLGDPRVGEATGNVLATTSRIAASMYIGPLTTLKLFLTRPLTVLQNLDLSLLAVLLASAILTLIFWRLFPAPPCATGADMVPMQTRFVSLTATLELKKPLVDIFSTVALGAVFLALGYSLVFRDPYFPPTWAYGRFSVLHFSGSFGGALLMGGLSWLAIFVAESYGKRLVVLAPLALYLGLLIGFHNMVQREFARVWTIEQTFWTGVVKTCPDLDDGTIILHEQPFNYVTSALANSWGDAIILREIFRFPPTWRTPPRVFSVQANWKEQIRPAGTQLTWYVPAALWAPHWETLVPSHVILLRQTGPGSFTRITGTIQVGSISYELQEPGPGQSFSKRPLYQYLVP